MLKYAHLEFFCNLYFDEMSESCGENGNKAVPSEIIFVFFLFAAN
jgi:hypothetical protein